MRVARGTQNKVLEAMAMGKPVVMTSAANRGIGVTGELGTLIADDDQQFVDHTLRLLRSEDGERLGQLGRTFVAQKYSWSDKMSAFLNLLGDDEVSIASIRAQTDGGLVTQSRRLSRNVYHETFGPTER